MAYKLNREYGNTWESDGKSRLYNIIHNYFEQISNDYANNFWLTFEKEQHLLTAAGASFFDERSLKASHFGTFVSIFLKTEGESYGYGVPLRNSILAFNWLGVDKELKEFKDKFKSEFDIDVDDNKTFIPQTIQTFVSFIGKAKRNLSDEQFNESFLNFVIALDLVFGEKGASTSSVSQRVAVITFKKFDKNFSDQKKTLTGIYDARSLYVHKGDSVETKLLDEVEMICQEVLFCMLRHRNYLQNDKDFEKWYKTMDFLVKAIEAEQLQPDSKYEEIGIWVK
ncbi:MULTISPECIES: HEPN domain-containing protein [Cyanophyceae]|uniref:HEPN domain-containing protein n=1 Tax=Cyanophyceae TaxID=3028117 RepID=UPI0023305E50|nr:MULTISPECIES: HEPN domain-containing protein [Cyanophyceae]MDB9358584.1 HEPN domain-containing protein [Nodularia spumigena CS-587/03]MDB9303743.1 HEPN domain-containing protein [Nodularia spumigena CS-591/12]MDB9324064.1 HEPN domain-containing protein [Nodularia spumigena CS-591/07A]MDB9331216.1 HEPN domain-containing protein [Nodularia spumigena CS-591/04]MDB9341797.1 HEPN domain-containing protein [Nodularia spumigena CS-589/07]